MSRSKALLSDTFIYAFAIILTQGFKFMSLPLLAHNLAPADLGAYDAVRTLLLFGSPLIALGMESAMGILTNEKTEAVTETRRRELASTGLVIVLISTVIGILILFLTRGFLYELILDGQGDDRILLLGIITLAFLPMTEYCRNLLKWQFRRKLFVTFVIGDAAFTLVVGAGFVLLLHMEIIGWMIAVLLSQILVLFGALVVNRNYWSPPRLTSYAWKMILLGAPVAVMSLTLALNTTASRLGLLHIAGTDAVGIYGVGERVAMIVGLVVNGFAVAWPPFYLSHQADTDAEQLFGKVLVAYLWASGIIGAFVILFAPIIVSITASSDYKEATNTVMPLVLYNILRGVMLVVSIGFAIRKRTHHLLWTQGLSAVLTLLLTIILVQLSGVAGAAWAIVIAMCAATVISGIVSQRLFKIKYYWIQLLAVNITIGMICLLNLFTTARGDLYLTELIVKLFAVLALLMIVQQLKLFDFRNFARYGLNLLQKPRTLQSPEK